MHERLSNLLGREVIGEVIPAEGGIFDSGLGRVLLDRIGAGEIEGVLERLHRAFPGAVSVTDQLHLDDPTALVRGLVSAAILRDGGPYMLQITAAPVVAYLEQRLRLEPDVFGDLTGALARGLAVLIARGEAALGVLSGAGRIIERHRENLDLVVRAAVAGRPVDPAPLVTELAPAIRRAWRLIPWPLRQGLHPTSWQPRDRIAPHDPLGRTLLTTVDLLEGEVVHAYVHHHNEHEVYDQVLSWMTDVHAVMGATYALPRYATAMARASSLEQLQRHYPRFRKVVEPN
jgi:hypothetical protein